MTDRSSAIAVVGMAGRFPGADTIDQLWRNLVGGIDAISRFSPDELIASGVSRASIDDPRYVAARGVLSGVDLFDVEAFGLHRAEATRIDPQHRMFLEQAAHALDDAAIDPLRFRGWIGVFGGCDASGYATGHDDDVVARLLGAEKDFLCTRVSHALRLRGPSVAIQTACSTSLVATHMACQSLLAYECDAALAGGVTVQLPQIAGYLHQEDHILSRDGWCRPFDAEASGTVSSSGVAVVVLRRLADALRDGDRIDALILGSAINNDGGDKLGYTAPSVTGQRDAIRLALANAGVTADTIGYVEAHGTATKLGDPVEIAALTAAFRAQTDRRGYCRIGSIKSNIGHAGAAAGVAGLVKTVCMLKHSQLVPSLHYRRPNPAIAFDDSPFVVGVDATPWLTEHGPLRAGVSSFGMGGTNAHAVLEAPPDRARPAERRGPPRIFPISARSPALLARTGDELATWLAHHPDARPGDVAATLATGRRQHAWRRAIVHDDATGAAAALRDAAAGRCAGDPPGVAFVFPGQGSVRVNTGRGLYEHHAAFRAAVDEASAVVQPLLGAELKDLLFGDAGDAAADARLHETDVQQVALFTLCWALVRQLDAWGVRPRALLGHSLGEYVAATVAGVWSPDDALRLVCLRGRLMQRTEEGRMLTVALPEAALREHLTSPGSPSVSAIVPGGCTVSGRPDAVAALADRMRARGVACVALATTRAFHSTLMEPILDEFRAAVRAVPCRAPALPFLSNLTGDWIAPAQVSDADYWVEQLRQPVRLDDGFARLLASDARILVHAGPGRSMLQLARRHAAWRDDHVGLVGFAAVPDGEASELLATVGQLWACGTEVAWAELGEPGAVRCALPPAPLDRTRCWRDPVLAKATAVVARDRDAERSSQLGRAPSQGAAPLVRRAWIEVMAGLGFAHATANDAGWVVVASSPVPWLAALSSHAVLARDAWPAPISPDAFAERMRAGAPPSRVVCVVPESPGAAVLDAIERCAAALAPSGELWIVGRWFCDVTGDEPSDPGAADILACIDRSARVAAARIRAFDLGTGDPLPGAPPEHGDGTVLWARRGRRWWAWSTLPVTPGPARTAACFTVLAPDRGDEARIGAALTAAGLAALPAREAGGSPRPPLAFQAPVAALAAHPELDHALDALCAAIIADLVLRRARLAPGESIGEAALAARIDPHHQLPRFVAFFVAVLCADGILVRTRDGLQVAADAVARADVAAARDRLGPAASEVAGLLRLLDHCARSYDGVFDGEIAPLSVIYPDGSDHFVRTCAGDNHLALSNAPGCLDALCRAVRDLRARTDRPLRILEIGAGQGELTWRLLDSWREDDVEYHVTDISPLLVRLARERASERGRRNLRFSVFDITADAAAQGVIGPFDAIVAYNVVHIAPSIPRALAGLRALLAPGGWLGLVEVTSARRWDHLAWGLAPGWWGFADGLRRDAIGLDAATWRRVLVESGFTQVAITPDAAGADHDAIIAIAPPALEVHDLVVIADPAAGVSAAIDRIRRCDAVAPASVWLVTVDPPPRAPREVYKARRALAALAASEARWHHLAVAALDAATLAALPAIVLPTGLPADVRLAAAAGIAAESGAGAGRPAPGSGDSPGAVVELRAPMARGPSAVSETPAAAVAAIWQRALGVTEVSPDAEFSTLGGDSLTSVHLLARLRERFGVELRMADFIAAPTLAGLTRLVEDAIASRLVRDRSPYVIPLQPQGARRPLFCVAPAAGSPLCYRDLAARLGTDQPFHGLEAYGLHDGEVPLRRIEDMAAAHIDAIRTVQPRGPYLLGGWSFGTLLAHEMAHQLERRGERVALLACLDAVVPYTRGRPCGAVPEFLVQTLWRQAKFFLELRVPRRFDELAYVAAWLGVRLTDHDAGGVARPLARTIHELRGAVANVPRFAEVYNANLRASLRYVPQPIACATVVFKTEVDGDPHRQDAIAALARPLVRGPVEVVPVAGNHMTMLDPRHVASLASQLRAAIDRHAPATNREAVAPEPRAPARGAL